MFTLKERTDATLRRCGRSTALSDMTARLYGVAGIGSCILAMGAIADRNNALTVLLAGVGFGSFAVLIADHGNTDRP